MARFDPKTLTLGAYRPGMLSVDCARCNRHVHIDRVQMLRRFGDITLHDLAQKIAARGGCQLATGVGEHRCSATAFEVPVDYWACLSDAHRNGWTARLICERHLAAMHPTSPCPGSFQLDVHTLVAILGDDFKLERIPGRCVCPRCHAKHVLIEWHVPDDPMPPSGETGATAQILRLRPGRAQLARQRFKAIEGGRG